MYFFYSIVTPAGTSPTRLGVNISLDEVLRDIASGGALCTKALDFLHLLLDKAELPVSEQEALINSLVDKCVNIHQSHQISQAQFEVACKVMTIFQNLHQWLDAELGRDSATSASIRNAAILFLNTKFMANVKLAELSLATLMALKIRGGAGLTETFDDTVQKVLLYLVHPNDKLRLTTMAFLKLLENQIRLNNILNPEIAVR